MEKKKHIRQLNEAMQPQWNDFEIQINQTNCTGRSSYLIKVFFKRQYVAAHNKPAES